MKGSMQCERFILHPSSFRLHPSVLRSQYEVASKLLDRELGEGLGLCDYLGIADRCAGELEYQNAIDLAARRECETDESIDQNRTHMLGSTLKRNRATGPFTVATEYGDQRFHITGAQRCDERIDYASLGRKVDLGRGRTLDAPARAAGELTRRYR